MVGRIAASANAGRAGISALQVVVCLRIATERRQNVEDSPHPAEATRFVAARVGFVSHYLIETYLVTSSLAFAAALRLQSLFPIDFGESGHDSSRALSALGDAPRQLALDSKIPEPNRAVPSAVAMDAPPRLKSQIALAIASDMAKVTEINNAADLSSYRLLWNALLLQTTGASFFQSLDWIEAYWKHYGAAQKLRVLVVYSEGRHVGILPLVVRSEATRIGLVSVLTYPLHDWGTIFGPIGSNPTATLLAALGHLQRTPRDWDMLDLRWVHPSLDRGRTAAAMRTKRWTPIEGKWATTAQISLAGSWNDYWMSRTSRWRNNVRRSEKKLESYGPVRHLRYRPTGAAHGDDDPRWDLYETCERLAEQSWQGDSSTGTTLTHASVREFLRDAHCAAAHAGALDLNLLYVGERPVAFNYAYQYRGYVFGLRTGYSRAPEAAGAGSVLQAKMIESSFALGDQIYDLGTEYLDCKRYWQTDLVPVGRFTYFPPTSPKAQLLRLKRYWDARRAIAKAGGDGDGH